METSEIFSSILFISFIVFIWYLIDRRSSKNEVTDTRKTIIDNVKLRKLSIYMIVSMLIIFVFLSLFAIWGAEMDDELVIKIFGSMGILSFAIIMINIFNNMFKIKE